MPPWPAALLLGVSGVWITVWLLLGAKTSRNAAGAGALMILACAAGLFILYRAPSADMVAQYCSRLLLSYAIPPEMVAGALLLAGGFWIAWLARFWLRRS
jgi:hypothetical protein